VVGVRVEEVVGAEVVGVTEVVAAEVGVFDTGDAVLVDEIVEDTVVGAPEVIGVGDTEDPVELGFCDDDNGVGLTVGWLLEVALVGVGDEGG